MNNLKLIYTKSRNGLGLATSIIITEKNLGLQTNFNEQATATYETNFNHKGHVIAATWCTKLSQFPQQPMQLDQSK